ncbi:NAD-dependent malic enzyme [Gammaproteobacteria bacterium]|nr:NAD-dependent malic enzyme [Gammaproteobacteria bacterium]
MTDTKPIYISHAGPSLLETPLLNKGSAFSEGERLAFNLIGLLPPRYENIEDQIKRAYMQFKSFDEPINQHIYLRAVQDNNETLFYGLLKEHLVEMLPIIYTPTVGEACEHFSDIYRSARGIIASYEERQFLDEMLRSVTKNKVKVIVVTDGERVLGLGDQGIGGMGIAIGKLAIYTACGGISPAYTLPVALDVGTNNETLLNDPHYMGTRHPRIKQSEYDAFVDQFIDAAQRRWPGVMIQFEDFAQPNAMPILQRHRNQVCCFNDDIQGTATVTLGTLLSACKKKGEELTQQKVIFVGSGSAGCGIAEQIIKAMVAQGLTDAEGRARVFMVDRSGLLTEGMEDLRDFMQNLAQPLSVINKWELASDNNHPSLMDVVKNTKATILIGVSGKPGLFTEGIIREMVNGCSRPIILPLSNPSQHAEAHPHDVLRWTNGKAIVATGSPFEPVKYDGETFEISQCNNSYVFPGVGLGVVSCHAKLISDDMLMTASRTLADLSLNSEGKANAVLPPLTSLTEISRKIALVVAKTAIEQELAREMTDEELNTAIEHNFWTPAYREYHRIA